jgi:hypothetical protein
MSTSKSVTVIRGFCHVRGLVVSHADGKGLPLLEGQFALMTEAPGKWVNSWKKEWAIGSLNEVSYHVRKEDWYEFMYQSFKLDYLMTSHDLRNMSRSKRFSGPIRYWAKKMAQRWEKHEHPTSEYDCDD